MRDQSEIVDLITKLIIDSNCSISAITETWLTHYDSTFTSQLTSTGLIFLLANIPTLKHGIVLAMLFSTELKIISSSTPNF